MRRILSGTRRDERPTVTSLVETRPSSSALTARRVLIRIGTSALIVAVLAGFLAGVATNHLPSFSQGNTKSEPVRGGGIVDGDAFEPDALLPYLTQDNWGVMVDQAIWAPLWYGDPQGAFHAGIAREVPSAANGDISPDLTTWTIHLRSGLKWSDGTPLTAADCAFSFNLYADPAYGTQGFPTTSPTDSIGFESAIALDDTTVVITLKLPYVGMLNVLADGQGTCLPQESLAGMRPADVAQSRENYWPTVTSGPFKIKERVGGDHVTVVRNPYYYQGPDKPYLDQITFKDLGTTKDDKTDALTPLSTHTVGTAWALDFTQLASYRAITGYTTYLDPYPVGYEVLVFNMSDPLIGDYGVRKAFTMGFDTHAVLAFLNGAAKLTCDDANGTFAHEESLVPCYHYDPAAASQLLDADGWRMGADGVRHKNGQPLELAFATTGRPWRQQTADLIERQLATIGMKLDVTTYSIDDYFGSGSSKVLAGGHFQIAEFSNGPGYDPDDQYFFASDQTADKGGGNYMHYANPQVDAQERIQQSTADITARKAAFHIIHEDVLKDVPVMYLYSQQNIACARSDLHNYSPSAFPVAETWNVWDWWLGSKGG